MIPGGPPLQVQNERSNSLNNDGPSGFLIDVSYYYGSEVNRRYSFVVYGESFMIKVYSIVYC